MVANMDSQKYQRHLVANVEVEAYSRHIENTVDDWADLSIENGGFVAPSYLDSFLDYVFVHSAAPIFYM
jgi:hypothetical protein